MYPKLLEYFGIPLVTRTKYRHDENSKNALHFGIHINHIQTYIYTYLFHYSIKFIELFFSHITSGGLIVNFVEGNVSSHHVNFLCGVWFGFISI